MELLEWSGKWLIVINPHTIGRDGLAGTRSRSNVRVRWTFDKCWSGDGWVPQSPMGKGFDTQPEAMQYLQDNRDRMEASL